MTQKTKNRIENRIKSYEILVNTNLESGNFDRANTYMRKIANLQKVLR